jgi:O-methyltransferase involved in polyketide biosynthesis
VADPFALALVEAARSHADFPTSWPADPTAASPLQRPLLLASIYIAVRTRATHAADRAARRRTGITVATDLSLPWRGPLTSAGFDPQQPTTWILEGLLPYLDAAAQLSVLKGVAALSAPGSRAVIERAVPLPKTADVEAKLRDFSLQTGLSMSAVLARADPPDPAALLTSAGWLCNGIRVRSCAPPTTAHCPLTPRASPHPRRSPHPGSHRAAVTALR